MNGKVNSKQNWKIYKKKKVWIHQIKIFHVMEYL